jgi:hypothetical protein
VPREDGGGAMSDLPQVAAPKTEAREAGVYVVPLLRKILAKYKASYPSVGEGCILRGEKMLRPFDLDNSSRRGIPPDINGAWFGRLSPGSRHEVE